MNTFTLHPLLVGYETRWLANLDRTCSRFFSWLLELKRISYSLSKWRFSFSLSGYINLPIMLIIESRMVSVFCACSPIFPKRIYFWCMLLDPHIKLTSRAFRHIYLIKYPLPCQIDLAKGEKKRKRVQTSVVLLISKLDSLILHSTPLSCQKRKEKPMSSNPMWIWAHWPYPAQEPP